MLPIESYNDCSLGENHEQEDDEKASEPLLSVIFSNDQYYIHQAKSYKRGIGLGQKCEPDRSFITDIIRGLASRAYIVVGDSVVDGLAESRQGEDDDDEPSSDSGVIVRAGDVIRFGRVCYLIKETSIDREKKAISDISRRQSKK